MPRFACLGSVQGVRGKEVGAVRARLSRRVREDEELGEREWREGILLFLSV